jgi:UDP-N-acetylmuramate--alanine ligase
MTIVEQIQELTSSLKSNGDAAEIYFIGIGGIGMSALAKYYHGMGAKVSGYDKTLSVLTEEMETMGMSIHYQEDVNAIPKLPAMVVYTPAVPKEHLEIVYYQNNDALVVKRSDVLAAVTNSSFNICVAGTHGKTTTSTMIAHILKHSGFGCNAFLGGVSVNYNTNFWSSESETAVTEADEYDRSFLKLTPDVAIITAMDPDHLDIYGTATEMENAFVEFASKVKPGGLLMTKYGLSRHEEFRSENHWTYSLDRDTADVYARRLRTMKGSYQFDVQVNRKLIENIRLNMGGLHNVENAVAAIAVASHLKIDEEKIRLAVEDFKGVRRRFEYVVKSEEQVLIDDYAHHPEELRALISSAKALFQGMKCTVVFQPHLYTRTRDLAIGFAESLDLADEVILLPIYPAREEPIEGVESEMIIERMSLENARVFSKEDFLSWVEKNDTELMIMAGAGDIELLVPTVKQIIENK